MATNAAIQAINEAFPLDQANALRSAGLQSATASQQGTVLQAATVAAVASADADATYGQPEADLINELKAQFNALRTALRTAGIVA